MYSKRIQSARMRVVLSISTVSLVCFFNSHTFKTLQALRNVAIREILESKKLTEPSQMTDSYTIFLGRQGVGGMASEDVVLVLWDVDGL